MSFQWTTPASMQGTAPTDHWRQQLHANLTPLIDPSRSTASPGRTAVAGTTDLSPPGLAEAPARSAPPVARIDPFRDHLQVPLTDDRTLVCPGSTAGMTVNTDDLPILAEGTTLVGIVDDGIAFASERFRLSADKTRFVYMWQQNQPVETMLQSSTVPLGREMTGADIDAMLSSNMSENEIYATLGLGRIGQRRLLRQANYGTSVADTVAGANLGDQIGEKPADMVRILGVNLPDASVASAAQTVIEPFVVLAVQRIADHVAALEAKASRAADHPVHFPLVLMLSMSVIDEAPDNHGPLPLLLRQIISDRMNFAPTHVMSPTPLREHTRILTRATSAPSYNFTVPPGCPRSTKLEITARTGIDNIRASLQPPSPLHQQDAPPPLDVGQFACLTDQQAPEKVSAAIYRSGARLMVMVAPSNQSGGGTLGTAQAGTWQLNLSGLEEADGVQVVIHRGTLHDMDEQTSDLCSALPRVSVTSETSVHPKSGKHRLHVTLNQDPQDPVPGSRTIPAKSGATAMATALATRRTVGTV